MYVTKQERKYALRAKERYIFFRDISVLFYDDIQSYLKISKQPRKPFLRK